MDPFEHDRLIEDLEELTACLRVAPRRAVPLTPVSAILHNRRLSIQWYLLPLGYGLGDHGPADGQHLKWSYDVVQLHLLRPQRVCRSLQLGIASLRTAKRMILLGPFVVR